MIGLIGPGVITITILALVPSTHLSIDDSCNISGPIEKLKLGIQGKRYWANQLQLLDNTVQDLEAQPEKQERLRRALQTMDEKTDEIIENNRRSMEELYLKHPELRPSPQHTLAQELRKRADAIERPAALETFDQLSAQSNALRLMALKSCRPIIFSATQ
jgi:arsenate reductase-like glutaredoxin family protein